MPVEKGREGGKKSGPVPCPALTKSQSEKSVTDVSFRHKSSVPRRRPVESGRVGGYGEQETVREMILLKTHALHVES